MSCVPLSSQNFEPGPQEYLNQLLTLISTLRGGESRYLPLIMAKIRDTLPAILSALPPDLAKEMADKGVEKSHSQHESNSSSAGSSPYSTPPFLHFYPLA